MQNPTPAPIYNRPIAGQAITSIIKKSFKTPRLRVKYSNVVRPFHYPNSPTVNRWSITCMLDPIMNTNFMHEIEEIERKEGVQIGETFKDDVTRNKDGAIVKNGNFLMKFQTRDKIPVIVMKEGFPEVPAVLINEIDYRDEVEIVLDIVRYTKRGVASMNKGISYQPKMIYLYPYESEHTNSPKAE